MRCRLGRDRVLCSDRAGHDLSAPILGSGVRFSSHLAPLATVLLGRCLGTWLYHHGFEIKRMDAQITS
jgi:hypothetical protein